MAELPPLPQPKLGRYRHYKGGEYEVIGVVRHSETLEPLVLYRPLYNATGLWVRPYAMFFEQVEHEGRLQARFATQTIEDRAGGFSLRLSDVADEEVRRAVLAPLARYNETQAGPSGNRPLVVELRDADLAIVGGLWGATAYGWLFTQLLVVPEQFRGQGLGSRLLALAEAEAINRGCHAAWLDTFEFQARAFYERLGYSCFATLADYPKGYSRYFLRKELVPSRET